MPTSVFADVVEHEQKQMKKEEMKEKRKEEVSASIEKNRKKKDDEEKKRSASADGKKKDKNKKDKKDKHKKKEGEKHHRHEDHELHPIATNDDDAKDTAAVDISPTASASKLVPVVPEGSYASLRRVYNWRQNISLLKEKLEEMEEKKNDPKISRALKAYYRDQIEQIEAYLENDTLQRAASIHPDDTRPCHQFNESSASPSETPQTTNTTAASRLNTDRSSENEPIADSDNHNKIDHDDGKPGKKKEAREKDAAGGDDDDDDEQLFLVEHGPKVDDSTEDADNTTIMFATRGSLILNILLFCAKVFLVIRSGSMAFIASLIDSALDLFSGAVMIIVAYAIMHAKRENYPTGKHKFEALGTLVFACAMFIASAKIIEECVYSLVDISRVDIELSIIDYCFIGFVIVSKGIAHLLCRPVRDLSPTIDALADDHRNDVLSNACAVIAVFCARYVSPYFDPAVGMATAFFMMFNWASTAYEQVTALSGVTADKAYVSALTFLALNHDPRVLGIDTVRCVTSGAGHLVEIDLLLPKGMSLEEAHDIGERLQMFLEGCESLEIARAYVHLDYETEHDPFEHR